MNGFHKASVASVPLSARLESASDWLIRNILPIGWIALLTGMFWIGDRAYYHKLYYLLLMAPTLLALVLYPARLKVLFSSPLLIVFAMFALYIMATLAWSNTDDSAAALAKRPLYVLFLFFAGGLLALRSPDRMMFSLRASAVIASLIGVISLGLYLHDGMPDRLAGYGALYNPLLSSHVYGFFMVFWMANWLLHKNLFDPLSLFSLIVLGMLIIATGSRTPLVALAACLAWLMVINWRKRCLIMLIAAGLIGMLVLIFDAETLFSRGLSFRPEIWENIWSQILDAPWFGHGYDAPIEIWIAAIDQTFADPHNMPLAVLYETGIVGLAFWLLLYALALGFAWRHRGERRVVIASALVVFGFAASMTEGGSFLSRPKEHWFLIWIPMTLLFSSELTRKNRLHA
jgi:O-antigen ligase